MQLLLGSIVDGQSEVWSKWESYFLSFCYSFGEKALGQTKDIVIDS